MVFSYEEEIELRKLARGARLNLIRDVFPDCDERVQEYLLDASTNANYLKTWVEIISRIEIRKVKVLEKIAEGI